jgi:multiple sugar transport system substrate-binding protein
MVNWPYVYGAAQGAVKKGALDQAVLDDIGWARYPRVVADKPSAPPLGGINLAIGNFTKAPDQALAAVRCITSLQSQTQYMVDAGNPAAKGAAFDDPKVKEVFPMASLIRDSINGAGPRPVTPYYGDVSASVQRTWHPASAVQSPSTPQTTKTYMTEVLEGRRLL